MWKVILVQYEYFLTGEWWRRYSAEEWEFGRKETKWVAKNWRHVCTVRGKVFSREQKTEGRRVKGIALEKNKYKSAEYTFFFKSTKRLIRVEFFLLACYFFLYTSN